MRIQIIFISLALTLMLLSPLQCAAYKMLFVMTMGTKSHLNFFEGVMETLVEKDHQITVVTPFATKLNSDNVKQIVLKEDYSEKLMTNTFELTVFQMARMFKKYVPEICVKALTQPEVIEAMNEDYDCILLSLFFADCFLNYIHEKKVPFIYLSPNTIMSPHSEKLGLPEFPSVTPNKLMPFTYPFSFLERMAVAVGGVLAIEGTRWTTDIGTEKMCREMKLWSDETPPLDVLQKRASLAIINGIRALEVPVKSIPPTIIYAGGIHIKPTKPLPEDIEDWLTGSGEHGFILFSLGTAVKPSEMKKEHLQTILNVFRSLKQRIIWKWDSQTIEDLPTNVKLSPWLPQLDILAHPKIRLFITHGGLFSTQESTYFGVPVIGMPVFADQIFNVAEVVSEGWGRRIVWDELTEERFRDVIIETTTNNSFRQKVIYRSKLMKDWPTKPAEEVSYWVEYVIRHKGAKHLQSPLRHLPWYQIYNVDVWVFIVAVLLVLFMIFALVIRRCFWFCLKKCLKRKTE